MEVDGGGEFPELFSLKLFSAKDLSQKNYIAHEILGTYLAKEFELRTPNVALIETDEIFLSTVPKSQKQDFIKCPVGLKFASRFLEEAIEYQDVLQMRYLTKDDIAILLAFDMMIFNADRTHSKPNLLISEQKFHLIDHERAFGYDTFQMSNISYLIKEHLLFKKMKKLVSQRGIDVFDSFRFYLEGLRFVGLEQLLDELERLELSGKSQRDYMAYLKKLQHQSDKFINLLYSHLK